MAFHPIIGTTRSASPETNRSRLLLNGAKKAGCRERLQNSKFKVQKRRGVSVWNVHQRVRFLNFELSTLNFEL